MTDNSPQDSLLFMLGEMRADLKYLVHERRKTSERLDAIEAVHVATTVEHTARLTRLETFKTKIGVVTVALGALVPAGITVVLHRLGLL